jgi:hypothetical protein
MLNIRFLERLSFSIIGFGIHKDGAIQARDSRCFAIIVPRLYGCLTIKITATGFIMKSINLVVATAAIAVSGAAMAGPSYTYADFGYTVSDSFGNNNETEGLALRGSFGFAEVFHVGGGYIDGEVSGGKGSEFDEDTCAAESELEAIKTCLPGDTSGYNLYFGFNPAMTENMDLVARIGYSDIENKIGASGIPDFIVEDTAVFLEIGPRAMVSEKLEINGAVSLLSGETKLSADGFGDVIKEDFTRVQYRVGGEYYFTPAISLGLDASFANSGGSNANLHVRYSFGNNK